MYAARQSGLKGWADFVAARQCWQGEQARGCQSAALSTLMLGGFTFQAPLLSLFAAGDAVGVREVGSAQIKKNW